VTPKEASKFFSKLAVSMPRELAVASKNLEKQALLDVNAWSSGQFTLQWMRQNDHPYARRWGVINEALMPPRINVQTGLFRRSWRTTRTDPYSVSFENVAPYASFLEDGTRYMLPRNLPARMATFMEQSVEYQVSAAVDRAVARAQR